MMETTQARTANHSRVRRWLVLDWAAIRRILFQRVVDAVLVVVAHVISDQPAMPTAEEDAKRAEERKDEFDHEYTALTCRNATSSGQRLRTASR